MKLPIFKLEDYFTRWEFTAPYLLCSSDSESWSLKEIISLADEECLTLWDQLMLGYTETKGLTILRNEICQLYESLEPHHIFTCAGAEEGIYSAIRAIIDPGDHVIVFTPCYQSLATLPKSLGAELTSIALEENSGWQINLEQVRQAFKPTTKLVILNFPHNPTGTTIDRPTFNTLIEIARAHQTYIFSDEVYRLMEQDESARLPTIADCYEKGISLSVTSKAFGLGGLRIGWLASQDVEFLRRVANIKHYLSICNSAPSEILALIALRAKEIILKRNRNIVTENLKQLNAFFQRYESLFSWQVPKGGCTAFPKLLHTQNSEPFIQKLIEEEGVLLLPGSIYDWPGSYFRIGFGRRNMPEALQRLENFIHRQNLV